MLLLNAAAQCQDRLGSEGGAEGGREGVYYQVKDKDVLYVRMGVSGKGARSVHYSHL